MPDEPAAAKAKALFRDLGDPDVDVQLTPPAKRAIRKYMLRWVIPSSAIFGLLTGLAGYVAGGLAKLDADNESNKKLVQVYENTSKTLMDAYENVSQARLAASQASTEAFDLKTKLQSASTDAQQARDFILNSKEEVQKTLTSQYDTMAKTLFDNPGFKAAITSFNEDRLRDIANRLSTLEHTKVIALGAIQSGKLVSVSGGLEFDAPSGRITFQNPNNLRVLSLVTTTAPNGSYITSICYVRSTGTNFFIMSQNALDTGGRNSPPSDCSFAVLGISN
jgi:hypothetical protein